MQTDDAVSALYARVGPSAYRLALSLVGQRAAAEDVVHEAFARLVARLDGLRDPQALDGYVTRAVRNLALNRLRRRRNAEAATETLAAGASGWVAPVDPADPERARRVARALGALPPKQREVVQLRVYEGLSFPQIAARTRVPLGTLHSRYRLALTRLRATLEEDA